MMNKFYCGPALTAAVILSRNQVRGFIALHGQTQVAPTFRRASSQQQQQEQQQHRQPQHRLSERTHMLIGEKPPVDPNTLLDSEQALQEEASKLMNWWRDKRSVICLTGAGLSTESGIPDYRGHKGSYRTTPGGQQHKPMVHDQFMRSASARQRYWARGMVGWRFFNQKEPASGHVALQQLETLGKLGVWFDDQPEYYKDKYDADSHLPSNGQQRRKVSLITQNVDTLHRRAGTKHVIELHGRTDRLVCMQCGTVSSRAGFHDRLESLNSEWLQAVLGESEPIDMRADGDAQLHDDDFSTVQVPACRNCGDGFLKPDVVFFGDSVPAHRVRQCQAAVDSCDGMLVVGSSLAVHSAFRHVRAAHQRGVPICILNVGETRADVEGLHENVLKIEAPAGPVLTAVADAFGSSSFLSLVEE